MQLFVASTSDVTRRRVEPEIFSALTDAVEDIVACDWTLVGEVFSRGNRDATHYSVMQMGVGPIDVTRQYVQHDGGSHLGQMIEATIRTGRAMRHRQASRTLFSLPIRRGEAVGWILCFAVQSLPAERYRLLLGMITLLENHLSLLEAGHRDALTGLMNRKLFLAKTQSIVSQSATGSYRLYDSADVADERRESVAGCHWVALIDIDHFKSINDNYGHAYGDDVLILVSDVMKKTFRIEDQLYRFGGEEFVVMIGPMPMADARSVFERFRRNVEQKKFGVLDRVTVSVGMSGISTHDDPTSAVGQADQAMYFAKENGRNQLAVYEDLVAAGQIQSSTLDSDVELF